jgi:hypothetical protein
VAWAHIDEITEVEADFIPTDPSYQSGDQWYGLNQGINDKHNQY